MKRVLVVLAIFVFSSLQVYPAMAINVDVNKMILSSDNITEDTGWITIDLSAYNPIKANVRSLYLAMFTGLSATCTGDTVYFIVRPYGDNNNVRYQFSRSTSLDPQNKDEHIQYVWLPLKSNKIQYKVESIVCSNVDVKLWIAGYEQKDENRWKAIYK